MGLTLKKAPEDHYLQGHNKEEKNEKVVFILYYFVSKKRAKMIIYNGKPCILSIGINSMINSVLLIHSKLYEIIG